ncbi:hypothetical protein Tco_0911761 [Tanacetum coccineum]|uniref:Uncharacterized protein n=1 Tax=Tanacetum coccineum TaxID=301880 RepID=A0ABQ5CZZ1_9ASTR
MMTSLMYSLLLEMRMNVREIHSRKPPLYRTRVSEEFMEARKLILHYVLKLFLEVKKSMAKIDLSVKEAAYHAWLGHYNSIREIGGDKTTIVKLCKGFCDSIGLEKVPALFRKTTLKMGLKDIAGICVRK